MQYKERSVAYAMITYVPSTSGGWGSLILQRSRARRQPSSATSVVPELVRLRWRLRTYKKDDT